MCFSIFLQSNISTSIHVDQKIRLLDYAPQRHFKFSSSFCHLQKSSFLEFWSSWFLETDNYKLNWVRSRNVFQFQSENLILAGQNPVYHNFKVKMAIKLDVFRKMHLRYNLINNCRLFVWWKLSTTRKRTLTITIRCVEIVIFAWKCFQLIHCSPKMAQTRSWKVSLVHGALIQCSFD